jgi:hypothetical protein
MAMTPCPECAKPVSTKAYSCPGCGYPLKEPPAGKKTGLWWGVGCLLAIPALFIVISIIGLLAAIGIPSFQKARELSIEKSCMNNMRILDLAKSECSASGASVTEHNISPYIQGGFSSISCMKGGIYTLNPTDELPECSVHGSLENQTSP